MRFRETQGRGAAAGAGLAAFAGTMTRYEGWFLLPFAAGWFWYASRARRLRPALLFCLIAGAGPVYWLAHNWYLSGDPLDFYRGPYSARAIQGNAVYPGLHDWHTAWFYYRTAAELCAGPGLCIMALAGVVVALARRAFWPLLLLALPGVFFVWSIHSSGLPIHVPMLWPHSYYNTRYGLAVLPLLAFAAAALVMAVPPRMRPVTAVLVVTAAGSTGPRTVSRRMDHLDGIAREFHRQAGVDTPGGAVPLLAICARFRYHLIGRRRFRGDLSRDGNPAARDLQHCQRAAVAGDRAAAGTAPLAGVGGVEARRPAAARRGARGANPASATVWN